MFELFLFFFFLQFYITVTRHDLVNIRYNDEFDNNDKRCIENNEKTKKKFIYCGISDEGSIQESETVMR